MLSSLYIGASGLKGLAEGMQVTTNNLANVSTIGFKQQNILFCDQLSQAQAGMGEWWNNQQDSRVAVGQVGMGLQVESIRTIYTQGELQSTNSITDLAISGKGFFQVSDGVDTFYTRAGDFVTDNEGVWRTPAGYALMGMRLDQQGAGGFLEPVQIDKFSTMPARATSQVDVRVNLNPGADNATGSENPFFSMLQSYNNSQSYGGLPSSAYSYAQNMTLYDANGQGHSVTAYFDGAPSSGSGQHMEFIIADEGVGYADESASGVLMSGVLHFDSAGKLLGVSAFTPGSAGETDLSSWHPSGINAQGLPTMSLNGSEIAVNFGATMSGGWQGAPASAADVGASDASLLAMSSNAAISDSASTAFGSSSPVGQVSQDGYAEGVLSNISIGKDGVIYGRYSNMQDQELWQIPVCRFTSEDGLYREGGNLFSATAESGQMEMGVPGTENYGTIEAYNIEGSNVDVSTEMVNMIINQRGFQSNSKVVTTADMLLQKAMEIKR